MIKLKFSDNPVKFSRVFEREVNHFRGWDLFHFFPFLNEEHSVSSQFPTNVVFLIVLNNELLQVFLVLDHEHLLHVCQLQAFVGSFSRSRNFISDCVCEFVNEKVVGQQGHVLLCRQDFLVAALNEVGL